MTISKRVKAMTLGQLADLLSYYNLYDTTKKSGEDSRPTGPALQQFLQSKLRELDRDLPKPVKLPGERILLDLWELAENGCGNSNTNLLLEIERELGPFVHQGNKALKRKPKEYAREVVLALFETGLFNGARLKARMLLLIHEDPFKATELQLVQVRGIDWVVYIQVIKADQQEEKQ